MVREHGKCIGMFPKCIDKIPECCPDHDHKVVGSRQTGSGSSVFESAKNDAIEEAAYSASFMAKKDSETKRPDQ